MGIDLAQILQLCARQTDQLPSIRTKNLADREDIAVFKQIVSSLNDAGRRILYRQEGIIDRPAFHVGDDRRKISVIAGCKRSVLKTAGPRFR